MVSALDSGSGGPGASPGQGTVLCSWARHFTLTVPLSTQAYKWVPANLLLGGNPAMDQHPIQGGVEILLVASSYRYRDKLWPDAPLGSNADFYFYFTYLPTYLKENNWLSKTQLTAFRHNYFYMHVNKKAQVTKAYYKSLYEL